MEYCEVLSPCPLAGRPPISQPASQPALRAPPRRHAAEGVIKKSSEHARGEINGVLHFEMKKRDEMKTWPTIHRIACACPEHALDGPGRAGQVPAMPPPQGLPRQPRQPRHGVEETRPQEFSWNYGAAGFRSPWNELFTVKNLTRDENTVSSYRQPLQ